jgi:hypothetical protein
MVGMLVLFLGGILLFCYSLMMFVNADFYGRQIEKAIQIQHGRGFDRWRGGSDIAIRRVGSIWRALVFALGVVITGLSGLGIVSRWV